MDDVLQQAAQRALQMAQRWTGEGSVLAQIADGSWATTPSSDSERLALARRLRAWSEQTRRLRAEFGAASADASNSPEGDGPQERLPLNRKERYYTGTVLPMMIGSADFADLEPFVRLCGLDVTIDLQNPRVELLTEYGFAESLVTASEKQTWGSPTGDTPDVVIRGEDWLVAVEAKMFHNPHGHALNAQMLGQSPIIRTWADHWHLADERVAHVLLLPGRLAERVREALAPGTKVVLWEDVLERYRGVAPTHWWNELDQALRRHEELESKGPEFGLNLEARLPGASIVTQFEQQTLEYAYMGRAGGLDGKKLDEDITTGAWRQRSYELRTTALPGNPNWFPVEQFVAKLPTTG